VDAALAALRSRERSGAAPIASELLERAWDRPEGDTGHEVALLHTGADALAARAHLIRAARESIDFQVFAWEPDEAGHYLFRLLEAAARRGVRVRVLVDLMANKGAAGLPRVCALHENLELRVYNPVGRKSDISRRDFLREGSYSFWRVNQRMHNKVLVVDGRIAIVGGRNVGQSYFDMDPEFDYLDRDALVIGPAARAADESFERYWGWERTVGAAYLDDVAQELLAWAAGPGAPQTAWPELPRYEWVSARSALARTEEVLPGVRFHAVERVDFLADPPGKREDAPDPERAQTRAEELEENRAREYVLVQSNYLVLRDERIRNLGRVLEERPELRVSYLTNSLAATANTMVYGVSRKQRTRILRLGLEVVEMRPLPGDVRHFCPRYDELAAEASGAGDGPRFAIHAKSVVVDGRWAIVSSHNLDPRSDELNTESGLVIWSPEVAEELESELRLLMSDPNSWRSARERRIPVLSLLNDIVTSISRALPIFDVWPVRDYGDYELREGAEPVASDDPRFRSSYRHVGEFPGVGWRKRWQTRFYSCFGGLIQGLL
jgi:phosphatidylserine/phosphatidylglycerophosphate/cardiolipin synthase-like enzyme